MASHKYHKKVKGHGKIAVVMHEFKKGKLRSSSGDKVTDKKQALAIALSEQRAAEKRGSSERTWRGRKRVRPNLKVGWGDKGWK